MRIPKFIGESGLAPNLCKPSAYPSVALADKVHVQGDLGGYLQTTIASAFNRVVAYSTILGAGFAAPFTAAANDSKPPAATQPVAQVASASAAATKPASVTPAGVKWDDVKVPTYNLRKLNSEEAFNNVAHFSKPQGPGSAPQFALVYYGANIRAAQTVVDGAKLAAYQHGLPILGVFVTVPGGDDPDNSVRVIYDGTAYSQIINPSEPSTIRDKLLSAREDARRLSLPSQDIAAITPSL